MSNKSIKRQWISRLMELCGELKADGTFKEVEWKLDLTLNAGVMPSLHVIIGDTEPSSEGPDLQGPEMVTPVAFKMTLDTQTDRYDRADELQQALETKIESDMQLNSLINVASFAGDSPFTNEINSTIGGTIVFYEVRWRRKRGQPEVNY